jgi:hypothetical protein
MADDFDSTFRLHMNKEAKMTSVVEILETGEEFVIITLGELIDSCR